MYYLSQPKDYLYCNVLVSFLTRSSSVIGDFETRDLLSQMMAYMLFEALKVIIIRQTKRPKMKRLDHVDFVVDLMNLQLIITYHNYSLLSQGT